MCRPVSTRGCAAIDTEQSWAPSTTPGHVSVGLNTRFLLGVAISVILATIGPLSFDARWWDITVPILALATLAVFVSGLVALTARKDRSHLVVASGRRELLRCPLRPYSQPVHQRLTPMSSSTCSCVCMRSGTCRRGVLGFEHEFDRWCRVSACVSPGGFAGVSDDAITVGLADLHEMHTDTIRNMLALIAEYDRREAWRGDGALNMASWLVRALGMSWHSAHLWLRIARRLEDLPAIAKAFQAGELSFDQARVLVRFATRDTDTDLAEYARGSSVEELWHIARQVRPVTVDEAADTHDKRHLRIWNDHETGGIRASLFLPAETGAGFRNQVESRAGTMPRNPHTQRWDPWEARCADALLGLLHPDPESTTAPACLVVAHIDTQDLTRTRASDTGTSIEAAPAISAETARRLSCDGYIQLVSHHPDGTTAAVSHTHKSIPDRLRRIVRYRDGGCSFPGCGRSTFSEIHMSPPPHAPPRTRLDHHRQPQRRAHLDTTRRQDHPRRPTTQPPLTRAGALTR